MWPDIAKHIAQVTGEAFEISDRTSVGGGCINAAYCLKGSGQTFFIKLNAPTQLENFAAEAQALKAIISTQAIKAPRPICWGATDQQSYLLLEWLEFGSGNRQTWAQMGRDLATMHRAGGAERFGWDRPNTIGATPQINTWGDNWADFFAEQRLGFQVRLGNRRGGGFPPVDQVIAATQNFLRDRRPQPSLLHGDLWSGNAAITTAGEPVILDPALYFGDREADLAMTELFGGFPAAFYQGYEEVWPLDSGYPQRKSIYNLYHVLNHFNLFGGGYRNQAQHLLRSLMS
ncbi:MAG: fructosamine kinase family protein [Cyanobacteria bacterium P01_H01_bin.15]